MKQVICYFDVRSPQAWLWLMHMPEALMGTTYHGVYRPVVDGAWHGVIHATERAAVLSLAKHLSIPLDWPCNGCGFDPLPLWDRAMAYTQDGAINRYVVNTTMEHVWLGGEDACNFARLAQLPDQLFAPLFAKAPSPQSAQAWLAHNLQQAQAMGVQAFPACTVDGAIFEGMDGLPLLRAHLAQFTR